MSLSNVYLFTGQEKYLLDKEIQRRKDNFLAKFGLESVFHFGVDNLDVSMIKQAIYYSGLFTTKKLILINGIPLDTLTKLGEDKNEQLTTFIDGFIKVEGKIPDDSLLVFVSPIPDKRLKLYKFLEKHATLKEFNQLKWGDLEKFITTELQEFTITHEAVQYFLTKVWSDLYRIRFECDKLKIRAKLKQQKQIDETMIDYIVYGQVETDSFIFLKALFTDKKKAISLLEKIQGEGNDRNQFAGMLYRAMKFYIFMMDLDESGVTDSKDIASFLKMNPRQVKNEYSKIAILKTNKKKIEEIYVKLVELDTDIKSWKVPDTYFRLWMKQIVNRIA
jgi:DNA polymerase III delta subunit